MPINCPDGGEARYRFTKTKDGKSRRLAFCGDDVVENIPFKKDKKGKLKKALSDHVKKK